jgi:hypothetical protein
MTEKDLLVVFNIFGHNSQEGRQIESYKKSLRGIFKQIQNAPQFSFRVVLSACMVSDKCIKLLKCEFKEKIHIFRFTDRYTCQVTSNRTILKSIEYFKEEYEGYLYYSSGIYFAENATRKVKDVYLSSESGEKTSVSIRVGNPNILSTIIEKLKSKKYGIIQLQVDADHGYHFLGHGPKNWSSKIDFKKDYVIPPGNHANFHIAAIHRSLKDFYGKPISDIHGFCGMESTLSYCCAALRKQYILMGDSIVTHHQKFDSPHPLDNTSIVLNTIGVSVIGSYGRDACTNLLWRRKKEDIYNDLEAEQSGLGYYPGPAANNIPDWNGVGLIHRKEKYDHDHLAIDPSMKESVKKLFFTNESEIQYHRIYCKIY